MQRIKGSAEAGDALDGDERCGEGVGDARFDDLDVGGVVRLDAHADEFATGIEAGTADAGDLHLGIDEALRAGVRAEIEVPEEGAPAEGGEGELEDGLAAIRHSTLDDLDDTGEGHALAVVKAGVQLGERDGDGGRQRLPADHACPHGPDGGGEVPQAAHAGDFDEVADVHRGKCFLEELQLHVLVGGHPDAGIIMDHEAVPSGVDAGDDAGHFHRNGGGGLLAGEESDLRAVAQHAPCGLGHDRAGKAKEGDGDDAGKHARRA